MDLLNRQASLLAPKTNAVTGSLLQDKPEDAVTPDPTKIQVAPQQPAAAPVAAPQEQTVEAQAAPAVSSVPEVEENPTLSRHDELRRRRAEIKQMKETKASNAVQERLRANRQALKKGTPTVPVVEDESLLEMAEDTFWAGARGFNQGVAFLLDLVPTAGLQAVELVDNYLLDDYIDTSRHQYAVSKFMDQRWGTTDSYETNMAAEIVGDTMEAAPMMITTAGSIARYGQSAIANSGVISQYIAPYTTRLNQSLGIDMAATLAGETAEEIVEEVAGEDSLWGTAANITTSIFSGTWTQNKLQKGGDIAQETAQMGGQMKTGVNPSDVNTEGTMAKARDAAVEYFGKSRLTNFVFGDMANPTGSFVDYNRELRAMGKVGKARLREIWDSLPDQDRSQFFANMETASRLGLKLTPYELLGHEGLKPLALATARITPKATLQRMDDNLDALERLIGNEASDLTEVARDDLKKALSGHNSSIEETAEILKKNLQERRQMVVEEIMEWEGAANKVDIGENFQKAVTEYVDATKAIFGKQFDEAVDKGMEIQPKLFTSNLVSSLQDLGKGTFTLPKKAGKLVNDLITAASPETLEDGSKAFRKISAGDLLDARATLNKGLSQLNVNDPMFQKNRESLYDAIGAIDDTLGQVLPKESKEALAAAKANWGKHVGEKFGDKATVKLVTRDTFNKPFHDGQEMIEVLFSGANKETKARAYADFLSLRASNLEEFAEGDDLSKVMNSAADAKLHIKQYVVNQILADVVTRKDAPVEEIVQGYMQRNRGVLKEVLDEVDFDAGKLIRDVSRGTEEMQKAIEDTLAKKLHLAGSGEIFDLRNYLNKVVLDNAPEADRLVKMMNDPAAMEKLGVDREAMQEMFAKTLVSDVVGKNVDGRTLDTNLRKLLDKAPGKLEDLIGAERVEHLKKFVQGHEMATRIKPQQVAAGGAENLDTNISEELGLGFIPTFMSDRLAIAKRHASAHYIMAARAIKMISGLNSDGYKKTMTKAMTDPEFFLQLIGTNPRTHDELKRLRIGLAVNGIQTAILSKKDADETAANLEALHAETEGSPHATEEVYRAVLADVAGINTEPQQEMPEEPAAVESPLEQLIKQGATREDIMRMLDERLPQEAKVEQEVPQ